MGTIQNLLKKIPHLKAEDDLIKNYTHYVY